MRKAFVYMRFGGTEYKVPLYVIVEYTAKFRNKTKDEIWDLFIQSNLYNDSEIDEAFDELPFDILDKSMKFDRPPSSKYLCNLWVNGAVSIHNIR